jgi:2-polyprenyl-6-hydroxyphenyl methylase/3-demethylubiquinone-9 3-methyltransferase
VVEGSVLDDELVGGLEPADVVYSWGVLHHTGDMYRAILNASRLVKPGGRLAIAIYNRIDKPVFNSDRWVRIKRFYNRAPRPVQYVLEVGYRLAWVLRQLAHGRNPLRVAREYKHSRGMAVKTDLTDWLGGYPYEFATPDEIVAFCEGQCGLRAIKVVPVEASSMGNHEFVFARPA